MTDRVDVSGVLDAIDNALGWTDPWADAMSVRYSDGGAGTPGDLAEDPGYRIEREIDWRRTPEGGPPVEMEMGPGGIRWLRNGVAINSLPIGGLDLSERDSFLRFLSIGSLQLSPMPAPRHLNLDALRAAVADVAYPEMVMSVSMLEALQQLGHGVQEAIGSLGGAVARTAEQVRSFQMVFDDIRPKRFYGPPVPPTEQAARSLALDARRNRNTGPARNPHRHRGI